MCLLCPKMCKKTHVYASSAQADACLSVFVCACMHACVHVCMPVSMFVHACVWACLRVCMPVCMHVWLKGSNMPCLFTQQLGIKYGAPLKQCRHLLKVASDLGLDVVGVRYAIIILPGSIKGTIIMCYNHFDCSFMLWFQQVMMFVGLLYCFMMATKDSGLVFVHILYHDVVPLRV